MEINNIIFYDSLPSLDIHGLDEKYAKIKINEYINDNITLKNEIIIVVHGIGTGILKNATNNLLKNHKKVLEYKIIPNNPGATIIKLDV